jgi:lipoprotein-anchoring transpeptidase ErfK/SrfK
MYDEEVIWDGTLYVPPIGTRQRAITGELGRFRLDLGDGYLLHGTPHTESIGEPSSHGCIRLGDEDIAWLYENVPVGTRVFTY